MNLRSGRVPCTKSKPTEENVTARTSVLPADYPLHYSSALCERLAACPSCGPGFPSHVAAPPYRAALLFVLCARHMDAPHVPLCGYVRLFANAQMRLGTQVLSSLSRLICFNTRARGYPTCGVVWRAEPALAGFGTSTYVRRVISFWLERRACVSTIA